MKQIKTRHWFSSQYSTVQYSTLIPLLLIAAITIIFFWKYVFLGEAFYPGDIHSSFYFWEGKHLGKINNWNLFDIPDSFIPRDNYYNAEIKKLKFPLWDPFTFSGHPFHADTLTGCAYPPKILFHYFLQPIDARMANLMLHLFLSGLFMTLFLKKIGVGKSAALFGAIAWMFNGYTMAWFEYEHAVVVTAMIPLVMYFIKLSSERNYYRNRILAGFFTGLAMLSGNLHYPMYLLILATIYSLIQKDVGFTFNKLIKSLKGMLIIPAVAIGIAAIQIIPAYELSLFGQRDDLSYEIIKTICRLPSFGLLTLIFPDVFGGVSNEFTLLKTDSMCQNYVEMACYFGIIPFALSLLAIFKSHRKEKYFFLIMGLLFVATAIGSDTNAIFYYLLPGFKKLFEIARGLIVFVFVFIVLASIGFDDILAAFDRLRNNSKKDKLIDNLELCGVVLIILAILYTIAFGMFSYKMSSQSWEIPQMIKDHLAVANNFQTRQFIIIIMTGIVFIAAARRSEVRP
jgi:hypothetical protein